MKTKGAKWLASSTNFGNISRIAKKGKQIDLPFNALFGYNM
jgi:hypothetical protein